MKSTLIIPIEIQQLANQQQRIVDQNNAKKIFDWEEKIREAKDFTSKGFPVPEGIDTRPPTLTRFDADKYMRLYLEDDAATRELDGDGKPGGQTTANLSEAFTPYQYEPPAAPIAVEPTQPINPLGFLIDDEHGVFSRAVGDKRPLGDKFNFMGSDYILTNTKFHNINGTKIIPCWVRQVTPEEVA